MVLSGRWLCGRVGLPLLAAIFVGFATFSASTTLAEERVAEPAATAAKSGAATAPDATNEAVSGREIFNREWLSKDSRSHGGDGLGPVFNDSSCVACHNQGGAGGGGPATKNVDIISAFVSPQESFDNSEPAGIVQFFRVLGGLPAKPDAPDAKQIAARKEQQLNQLKKELTSVHPGFKTARSVVLHQSSSDPKYHQWRSRFLNNRLPVRFRSGIVIDNGFDNSEDVIQNVVVQGDQQATAAPKKGEISKTLAAERQRAMLELQRVRNEAMNSSQIASSTSTHGNVTTTSSQRNPTALFGAGLIDSISNETLEAQANVKHSNPNITGRVARLENGKIGRFGWKSQKANLYDFTVTACGVELGLNVPDHPQSGQPLDPKYQAVGFDLNQREVDALVGYLKDLPAPVQQTSPAQKEVIDAGAKLFSSTGCADCHVQKLGNVEGIYSDLLLHDMGDETADTGGYGTFVPNSPGSESTGEFPALTDAFSPAGKNAAAGMNFSQPSTLQARAREIEQSKITSATRFEWRTPPLWGVRDSGPYMHDGRAATLEHAVAMHGGEADEAARDFFALNPTQQQQLVAFMKTLVAPTELASAK